MVEDHHQGEHNNNNNQAAASKLVNSSKPLILIEAFNSSDNHQPFMLNGPVQPQEGNNTTSSLLDNVTKSLPDDEVGGISNSTKLQQQLREPVLTGYPTTKKSLQVPMIWQEKFLWDQVEQGQILGAFFYGYILFQVPGARMAESAGAKWIIMAASASSAVISLIFPLSTQLNSIYLLMVLRFVMGLCQSGFFPAAYVLSCRWFPERERAVILSLMFIGGNIGSISTYIMSSYLISSSYGWPSVFYVSGAICSLCSLLWLVFGSSVPSENWLITEQERHYIEFNVCMQENSSSSEISSLSNQNQNRNDDHDEFEQRKKSLDINDAEAIRRKLFIVGGANGTTPTTNSTTTTTGANATIAQVDKQTDASAVAETKLPLPPEPDWFKLLASIPVWTLIFSMYGNEWSTAVICYELPTYLNTALNFPIEQNGFINSFFQLTYSLASPIMSAMGAYVLATRWLGMRKVHVRKLFQSLATFGQMVCFISVPICGPNRGLIIMFMFSAIIFKACAYAGDLMVPGDLSPDYAGTIFAFCNSIGNTAGFFVPTLTGIFVTNAYQREQWAPFWFTSATIMGCSGLIFILFGETRRQDFSLDGTGGCIELEEADDDNNKLMNTVAQQQQQQKKNGKNSSRNTISHYNDNNNSNKETCCKV